MLKKISMYVKSIIFSQYNWISRSHILHQIYLLDQDISEFTYSNVVTRSNLKRRVYDSINVLYASDIVERRVEHINFKKEYFFKPKVAISSLLSPEPDVLRSREDKQVLVKDKLKKLHRLHNRYLMQKERLEILERLVNRNKKNEVINIRKLEIGDQPLNLENYFQSDNPAKSTKRKVGLKVLRRESNALSKTVSTVEDTNRDRVKLPFYFYKLKSHAVSLNQSATFEGKHRLSLLSKCPPTPFLFEDFEIIKKLI